MSILGTVLMAVTTMQVCSEFSGQRVEYHLPLEATSQRENIGSNVGTLDLSPFSLSALCSQIVHIL